jgi:hypothetical protein
VIGALVYFGAALWLNWYILRVLYIAKTRGYVMALTRPFIDTVETPQTRADHPKKFWANVIVATLCLPIAIGGLWFSAADLARFLKT